MITLFLSLMIVYVLLYQVKWDKLKIQDTPKTTDWKMTITAKTWTTSTIFKESTAQTMTGSYTWKTITNTLWNTWNKQQSKSWTVTSSIPAKIKILSWTDIYYGVSPTIEKLWIKYQYALKDSQNIYYFNLGNPTYDFGTISKSLWWNTFTLITEQDIFQNKLFWKKVIFINLPGNKDKLVIMVVYVWNEVWLIEVSYDIYHKSKEYIKNLFID